MSVLSTCNDSGLNIHDLIHDLRDVQESSNVEDFVVRTQEETVDVITQHFLKGSLSVSVLVWVEHAFIPSLVETVPAKKGTPISGTCPFASCCR